MELLPRQRNLISACSELDATDGIVILSFLIRLYPKGFKFPECSEVIIQVADWVSTLKTWA